MNKKYATKIVIGIVLVVVVGGIYWWQRGDALLVQPRLDTEDIVENRATNALKAVVDVANELSGITSGAVFNFEVADMDGRSANFGIVQWIDDVRGDRIVEEHIVKFRETGTPTDNISEVDRTTNRVVALHRTPVDFGGTYVDKLEAVARQFVERVYPEFTGIEPTLEYVPGRKTGGVATNYFFRWNDKRFAVPNGLEMDLPPFIQVGITASGFIFSYDNTVQLYHNLSKEALRTLCGFVAMPKTDDSSLDREKGIVKVWFTEYEPFQNRYLVLPYEPETDFEGCSESAKTYLRHLPNDSDKN
ncbi:TPA: hypothetical protein DIS55_02720 [Candidatus Kaiserbacteria bacterium]|nr:hypothetical protein [Candidatus Kaiserbacteria bacterium]